MPFQIYGFPEANNPNWPAIVKEVRTKGSAEVQVTCDMPPLHGDIYGAEFGRLIHAVDACLKQAGLTGSISLRTRTGGNQASIGLVITPMS